jgi:hypothetical protein
MKVLSRQVRFIAVSWRPWRKAPRFIGRSNTVQVLETAVVIEGYLKRLSFPVLDWLFQQALSEWTTMTIPYARIVSFQDRNAAGVRMLRLGCVIVPALVCALGITLSAVAGAQETQGLTEDFFASWAYIGLMFGVLGLLMGMVVWIHFRPRIKLAFRLADDRLGIVAFRIRPRALQQKFVELVQRNRRAAEQLGSDLLIPSGQ